MAERTGAPALQIEGLHVAYGAAQAIQGVSLTLASGVLSVVGRNGMGKSALCNAITGLKEISSGSIRLMGREIAGLEPHVIHRLGVGYVPQGRRVWPSLSVAEHLALVATPGGAWTEERVYAALPRLAERRTSMGTELSGGEQQMLAIGRALLGNPALLVLDEPTEGLAPVIVDEVTAMLARLGRSGEMAVLVIEQNLGVALGVADEVAIMVNGRIARVLPAAALAADRDLQQRLLGVGRQGGEESPPPAPAPPDDPAGVWQVWRAAAGAVAGLPNLWNLPPSALRARSTPTPAAPETSPRPGAAAAFDMPLSDRIGRTAIIAGTFDTKGRELMFLRDRIAARGIPTRTVDLSTSGKPSPADVPPLMVASMHPRGASAVITGDRGASVAGMAEAFARWIVRERGIGGVVSAGGSGGTTLATAGMRALPVGIPKLMVSTLASGQVAPYVGSSDILMLHSVADVQGLNSITETVLANAAHALAGMIAGLPTAEAREARRRTARPALGLTMFGVTTPCVQAVTEALGADYDCLVFHATGTGGRAMEALGHSRLLAGFLDITTTEVADMLVGGVLPADAHRFGAAIATGLPWVGSVGALDMVNFGPRDTVPETFAGRNFVVHNPTVTLMRTTRAENRAAGEWIGARLNEMEGPVRLLLPEGGVSTLDAPGQPFHDPEADAALFEALERTVRQTPRRQILRVPAHINAPEFARALVAAFRSIAPQRTR